MKGRLQKIFEEKTCPQKNRTESEGYVGGQTFMWIAEKNLTENDRLGCGLLEFILSPASLNTAYLQVKRNKGVGGVGKAIVISNQFMEDFERVLKLDSEI